MATMTKEEYNNEIKSIKEECDRKLTELAKRFALTNNPYKIGDIRKDHYHIIQIQKIGISLSLGVPECRYSGIQLTAKLQPAKRQTDTTMCQCNVKEKLN